MRAPPRVGLPLSYSFVLLQALFQGKYEIGFVEAVDCFESAKESPHDAEVVSQDQAGEGRGGGPSWLGMKGQMMPVHTARLHINLHLHFFFFF